jgi:hypothetical protein
MIAPAVVAITIGAAIPGPWWVVIPTALTITLILMAAVAPLLRRLFDIADAAPATVPSPGPDDPVHYVPYGAHRDGCTIVRPHAAHPWYYRTEAPTIEGGNPTMVAVTGHVWCRGIR